MTQVDILEMADQAFGTAEWTVAQFARLVAFAELVEAKTKKELLEDLAKGYS